MSEAKAAEVSDSLDEMKLAAAAKIVREGCSETLAYTEFPMQHWTRIRTNNATERLNRVIRRRTRVVGKFPDDRSALMLVTARLKYIVESEWGSRRCLDVSPLEEKEVRVKAVKPMVSPGHQRICERLLTVSTPEGSGISP